MVTEIKAVHHIVEESEWVVGGGVHADEWDDIRVRKLIGYLDLLEEPLWPRR